MWRVKTFAAEKLSGAFPDSVFSFDWNYDGSLIALTTKDKKVRVFDPRSRSVVQVRVVCVCVCMCVYRCVACLRSQETDDLLSHLFCIGGRQPRGREALACGMAR
jgi:WD40 repeat protein